MILTIPFIQDQNLTPVQICITDSNPSYIFNFESVVQKPAECSSAK